MDTDAALAFLAMHQPLPFDPDIDGEVLEQLDSVIEHFKANRDSRCIHPLFFAMGPGGGYDRYRRIINLLADYPKEDVMPVVLEGLRHPDVDHQFKAFWLGARVGDDRLREIVQQKLFDPHDELRDGAAMAYANFVSEQDREWLDDALERARNDQERLEQLLSLLDDQRGGKAR